MTTTRAREITNDTDVTTLTEAEIAQQEGYVLVDMRLLIKEAFAVEPDRRPWLWEEARLDDFEWTIAFAEAHADRPRLAAVLPAGDWAAKVRELIAAIRKSRAATAAPEAPISMPFVVPEAFVQDVFIPVAYTEGAVALDLTALLPDLIREIRRHAFDTDDEVLRTLQAKGYAAPQITIDAADSLAEDLVRASWAAEEAGTVPETTARRGD